MKLHLQQISAPAASPPELDATSKDVQAVEEARRKVAFQFLSGRGLEVGAGSRPFPLPPQASVIHGDIRDLRALEQYFQSADVQRDEPIDAQTFASLADNSLDFLISAHVIEHLRDPLGSILQGLRILRAGKPFILVVPDMRRTFDRHRPETTLAHALQDLSDGGEGTCHQAYEEHLRFVHPFLTGQHYSEEEIQRQATENVRRWRDFDIHFHAWARSGFEELLAAAAELDHFTLAKTVSVFNENIFVLLKK